MSAKHRGPSRPQSPRATPARKVSVAKSLVKSSTTPNLPTAEQGLTLINELRDLRQAEIITFVTPPGIVIRGDVIEQLFDQLHVIGRVPRIDLFLHSTGGQTEIPWRIITLIREYCDDFAVLVPAAAYSAATHLAMGANEIVMGPLSELSPVDPARSHPLLPWPEKDVPPEPISVQDLRHCVQFIKRELRENEDEASNPPPEAMATIFPALFEKIHPLAIGAIQQSYELSRLISTKALSTHMDPEAEADRIERIVSKLSDEFFSHHYRIGRREAKEIGLKVTDASDELWEAMLSLYRHYQAYFSVARDIGDGKVAKPIVWIDSIHQRRILEQIWEVDQDQPIAAQWTSGQWVHEEALTSNQG